MSKNEMYVLLTTEDYRRELKDRVRGRKVLELGVGTGVLTKLLLDAGAIEVVGYEILPNVCEVIDRRFTLHRADYTKVLTYTVEGTFGRVFPGFCLVANPAYSTLPFIVEMVLPHVRDVILMIPERMLTKFRQLGFHELFKLEVSEFDPRAEGVHYVVVRGFDTAPQRFLDLEFEVEEPPVRGRHGRAMTDDLRDWADLAVERMFNDQVRATELNDGGPPCAVVHEEGFQPQIILGRGKTWPEAIQEAWSEWGTSNFVRKNSLPTSVKAPAGEEFIEEFCQAMRQRDLLTEFLMWYQERADRDPEGYTRELRRIDWLEQLSIFIEGLTE